MLNPLSVREGISRNNENKHNSQKVPLGKMSFSNPLQFCIDSAYKSIPNQPARYSHSKLGYFSVDQERYFLPSKSELGVLNLPCPEDRRNLDIDLNAGFEEWKNLPNVQQHLDSMLYWIMLNKDLMTVAGDIPRDNSNKVRYSFVIQLPSYLNFLCK